MERKVSSLLVPRRQAAARDACLVPFLFFTSFPFATHLQLSLPTLPLALPSIFVSSSCPSSSDTCLLVFPYPSLPFGPKCQSSSSSSRSSTKHQYPISFPVQLLTTTTLLCPDRRGECQLPPLLPPTSLCSSLPRTVTNSCIPVSPHSRAINSRSCPRSLFSPCKPRHII
jgi:hypothetical protein